MYSFRSHQSRNDTLYYYKSVTHPLDADATVLAYLYKIPFLCFSAGAVQLAFLSESSSSEIKTSIELSSALILMISPVFKSPIVPPD